MTIQSYKFLKQPVYNMIPPMTTRLVAFFMELGGTIHVMKSLHGKKCFGRSKHQPHQRMCLVHLFTLPYDAKRGRPTANYYWAHRSKSGHDIRSPVNWQKDMVLVFKDATLDWDRRTERASDYQCETPVTFLVVEYELLKIRDDPLLLLTRANGRLDPKSSLNSSRSLNVTIIGLSFHDIVNQARRVRKNILGSPILLRRYVVFTQKTTPAKVTGQQ